jgi:hypothetical protein
VWSPFTTGRARLRRARKGAPGPRKAPQAHLEQLDESASGDDLDLPPAVLRDFLDAVAAGRAHADMEAGNATGKLVVLP